MKNDPIIHAKASKIVEAIIPVIKAQLLSQMHLMVHHNDYPSRAVTHATIVDMAPLVSQPLTEALASLGGESELNPEEKRKELQNQLTRMGLSEEYKDGHSQGFADGFGCCYNSKPPHPSEREVLEGFAKFFNLLEGLSDFILPTDIDRYLAEKQSKTEKKWKHY